MNNIINRLNKFLIKYNMKIMYVNEVISNLKLKKFSTGYSGLPQFLGRSEFKFIIVLFENNNHTIISDETCLWQTYDDLMFSNTSIFNYLVNFKERYMPTYIKPYKDWYYVMLNLEHSSSNEELAMKMDLLGI